MEKFKFCSGRKFISRLLKIFFLLNLIFFGNYGFSQNLTSRIIKTLSVVPQDSELYTDTDILFSLEVPYVSSNEISYDIQKLPEKVHFKSARQNQSYSKNGGVVIELWFSFDEEGFYRLPSLLLKYRGRNYSIAFKGITILPHPKKILPRVIYEFENGEKLIFNKNKIISNAKISSSLGKPLVFSVYVQYALQVLSVNSTVLKNAVFSELEKIDSFVENPDGSSFSSAKIPVAKFSWIPISKGLQVFPEIVVSAVSYSGERQDISLPDFEILVKETQNEKKHIKTYADVFPYAFVELSEDSENSGKPSVSVSDCKKIASLRINEKYSHIWQEEKKIRREFEESLGIYNGISEKNVNVFAFCSCFTLLLFLLSLFFIIKKRIFVSVALVFAFFAFSAFSLNYAFHLTEKSAVIINGKIRNVPEVSVEAIPSVENGSRVKVLQEAGNWVFIEFENISGWTPRENIIFIDKTESFNASL